MLQRPDLAAASLAKLGLRTEHYPLPCSTFRLTLRIVDVVSIRCPICGILLPSLGARLTVRRRLTWLLTVLLLLRRQRVHRMRFASLHNTPHMDPGPARPAERTSRIPVGTLLLHPLTRPSAFALACSMRRTVTKSSHNSLARAIWSSVGALSRELGQSVLRGTHAMLMCSGSSDSLPVSFSIKPDPRPLIWTLDPVSAWMYFTNMPCV